MMQIYKITNTINSKCYIGQTIHSPIKRFKNSHCDPQLNTYIARAIRKYGKENFKLETLIMVDSKKELDYYEKECIKTFNSLSPNGYNLTTGGEGSEYAEESRKKISESNKKAWLTRNRFISEDHKRAISKANKGKVFSETHRENLRQNALQRPKRSLTEGHKAKVSAASKKMWESRSRVGRPHTPEEIEKIRISSTGRGHTLEARQKISKTRIERYGMAS